MHMKNSVHLLWTYISFVYALKYVCDIFFYAENLWVAPEFLRDPNRGKTKEGDIYSIGIIMREVATREGPYAAESRNMELDGIPK